MVLAMPTCSLVFHIASVCYSSWKVLADIPDGSRCDHIAHQIGRFGNVAFCAVEECVKSLVGSEFRWDRCHQFRIDNREDRKMPKIDNAGLFVCFSICDDAAAVYFRACACCRRDVYHRERLIRNRLAFACTACYIVPKRAVICRHDGNGLCASMTEPPPKATRKSAPKSRAAFAPSMTVVWIGFA